MDKNAIKKYAVWARRELISRVSQKALQYGISEKEIVPASAASVNGVVLSAEEIKQRKALIEQINAKGYEHVMEEVAYTWFNRFIALRFMEVNGYLPSHVRVFTDEDNAFRPQIITEAINLELDGLDMDKVYAWKDANDNDSLFKYLIITQCNALSPILPRMFQRIADYTELLFPDNLLREGSVIQQMIELIPEDDWKDAVQIIGWLYQFYNIEPKAEVFAKIARFPKNEILFRRGITWTLVSMNPNFGVRELGDNLTFNKAAATILFDNEAIIDYLLGFMNSRVAQALLRVINPTMNNNIKDVLNMPYIYDCAKSNTVKELVQACIRTSKEDWDAFEVSWDFKVHPLVELRTRGAHAWADDSPAMSVETAYKAWESLCEGRFTQLKANEEKLNCIFIDIYGLQDELTSEVEDKNVTVRLADKKRDIKSLISYAVGCMFGRYSLDVPGLAYAGGEWDDSKYTTFKADKDSIIPICDDEYFADDIVGRFIRFIEVVYGKDTLQENLRFIADALGGSGQPKDVIRNYFLNGFYADHLKVYQKRPIYWLFDSGKKNGFKALVYMHRYQPDTIARMRTDYVHEQQARYRTAIADLEQRIASASTAERVKLSKRLKQLQEQATEIQCYEEKIHHLADQYIAIDLDDGVKKNYAIFQDVLAKIK